MASIESAHNPTPTPPPKKMYCNATKGDSILTMAIPPQATRQFKAQRFRKVRNYPYSNKKELKKLVEINNIIRIGNRSKLCYLAVLHKLTCHLVID